MWRACSFQITRKEPAVLECNFLCSYMCEVPVMLHMLYFTILLMMEICKEHAYSNTLYKSIPTLDVLLFPKY